MALAVGADVKLYNPTADENFHELSILFERLACRLYTLGHVAELPSLVGICRVTPRPFVFISSGTTAVVGSGFE